MNVTYRAMSEAAFSVLNSEDPPARGESARRETSDESDEKSQTKSENEKKECENIIKAEFESREKIGDGEPILVLAAGMLSSVSAATACARDVYVWLLRTHLPA